MRHREIQLTLPYYAPPAIRAGLVDDTLTGDESTRRETSASSSSFDQLPPRPHTSSALEIRAVSQLRAPASRLSSSDSIVPLQSHPRRRQSGVLTLHSQPPFLTTPHLHHRSQAPRASSILLGERTQAREGVRRRRVGHPFDGQRRGLE